MEERDCDGGTAIIHSDHEATTDVLSLPSALPLRAAHGHRTDDVLSAARERRESQPRRHCAARYDCLHDGHHGQHPSHLRGRASLR